MNLSKNRLLGHPLHTVNICFPTRCSACLPSSEWKRPLRDKQVTWEIGMRKWLGSKVCCCRCRMIWQRTSNSVDRVVFFVKSEWLQASFLQLGSIPCVCYHGIIFFFDLDKSTTCPLCFLYQLVEKSWPSVGFSLLVHTKRRCRSWSWWRWWFVITSGFAYKKTLSKSVVRMIMCCIPARVVTDDASCNVEGAPGIKQGRQSSAETTVCGKISRCKGSWMLPVSHWRSRTSIRRFTFPSDHHKQAIWLSTKLGEIMGFSGHHCEPQSISCENSFQTDLCCELVALTDHLR